MRLSKATIRLSFTVAGACAVFSCSDASTPGIRVGAPDAGSNGGADDGGQGGASGNTSGGGSSGASGGSGSSNTGAGSTGGNDGPEVCDGVDNDGNGIIDDVDAGMDGICDCLNIGVIGRIGPWSNGGNIFKSWLNTRSPRAAQELGDQVLTAELLSGLDVVVVLRADTMALSRDSSPAHHAFSAAEVAALEAWVRGGGGLLTTIGYQADEAAEVENVNRLLAPLGMRYQNAAPYLSLEGDIASWVDHPVAEGVTRVRAVNGVEPAPAGGTSIAQDPMGRVAMVVGIPGEGRVIVFGDEWITYDSEWVDVQSLQVERLWLNMLKWMSPPQKCQVEIPVL